MLARSTLLLTAHEGSRHRRSARNRAFDGVDNAAMALHLAPAGDPFKNSNRDFADQQLFSDYRRRSLTADSEATSTTGRTRGDRDLPSTTPLGSYINGVLGGLRHPGLAAHEHMDEADADEASVEDGNGGEDEIAAAAGANTGLRDESPKSLAKAASDSVVRMRMENARLAEQLRVTEQRLRQVEREKTELAEKAVELADELTEAREELREERKSIAALRNQTEELAYRRAHTAAAENDAAASGGLASPALSRTTLDGDLEQASRRVQSLERSMLEMKRRFARLEDGPPETSSRRDEANEQLVETAATGEEAGGSASMAMAAGAMSQEIAELRASTESLRRRMVQQEERRKQQLAEATESRAGEQRASEEALLAVSLGLETAKAQNADLRKLLDRSERIKSTQGRRLEQLQTEYGQLRTSAVQTRQAWEDWAVQVEAGREELHRLGDANAVLRERLAQFDKSLAGLQQDLEAAKADAALQSERCRRLAADVERSRAGERRARDSEAKAAQLGDGMAKLLALADAENRGFQRRLGVLAEAAQKLSPPEMARLLRELAANVRTDFQGPDLSASDWGLSRKLDRLLAKLQDSRESNELLKLEVKRLQKEQQIAIEKLSECEANLYLAKEVAGAGPEAGELSGSVRRQSHVQLAALIEQIDMVESKSDNLLIGRRRAAAGDTGATVHSAPPALNQKWLPPTTGGLLLNGGDSETQTRDVQRLMRMLLYNSKPAM